MPLYDISPAYEPNFFLKNRQLQTILPSVLGLLSKRPLYKRERITTPDEDFLDIDWLLGNKTDTLAILSHGLEGNSYSSYIVSMARFLNLKGLDILCWNLRGCSGELNRKFYAYHSGKIEDLDCVANHAISTNKYKRIILIGFSLSGNIVLKFMGVKKNNLHSAILGGIAFSTPIDLYSTAKRISYYWGNFLYEKKFIHSLLKKARRKCILYGEKKMYKELEYVRSLQDFDDVYTGPVHNFKDAIDYWTKSSSRPNLMDIQRPTLLLNALDDPMLGSACYPFEEAKKSKNFFFMGTTYGGHVGFLYKPSCRWSEYVTWKFIEEIISPQNIEK